MSRERVACGATHPDPEIEERFVALRANEKAPSGFDGCGRAGVWTFMFRCVECGRWMHKDCILRHFESHRTPADVAGSVAAAALEIAPELSTYQSTSTLASAGEREA